MKRLLLLIIMPALGAPTFALTLQSMPPPVTTRTMAAPDANTAPAANPAAANHGAPPPTNSGAAAAANRGAATPAKRGAASAANRASAAPAATRAYVGTPVVKSWAKPVAAKAAPATKPAGTADADDSFGLRKGTVQAVSQGDSTFHVYGQRLTFDAKHVKVFKGGKPASVNQLRAGANVRFTMDPADPLKRRVGVIYLD